jgi:tetratricopeptide (TPR) repeat protein
MSIRIGLHLIVKNDIDRITKCIESQAGLADIILVAVDAGRESDKTYDWLTMVDVPGLHAYRQEWKDDFSWARNDCLQKLIKEFEDLDYVYWVDSDDIWDPSAKFDKLREKLEKEQPRSVMLPYQYTEAASFYRVRFWKVINGQSVNEWTGGTHEIEKPIIFDCGEDVTWDELKLVHTKEDINEAQTKKHTRNISILKNSYEKDPSNLRNLFYLGREYYDNKDFTRAIAAFDEYLNLSSNIAEKYQALLDLTNIYFQLELLDKAEESALEALALYPEAAFAPALLGEVNRLKGKWYEASIWYKYAIDAPPAPVIFDFENLRTILPLRWLSVAYSKLGRMEEAALYHCKAGECRLQDGYQQLNDVWLFSNKYVPNYLQFNFKDTEKHIDSSSYIIIENFNDAETKTNILEMQRYNNDLQLVRILNEGTSEAAAVLFKGYNDFHDVSPEEKEKLRTCSYKELIHPKQLSLFEDFYIAMMQFALKRNDNKPLVVVELGSDQGLSTRLFVDTLRGHLEKLTCVDTNLKKELWSLLDNTKVCFIHDTAENASKTFADGSIDILHADLAPHSYNQSEEVLALYESKLKKSGIIIWHDSGLSRDFNFGTRKFIDTLRYPWVISYCREEEELIDVSPACIWRINEQTS